MLEVIALVAEGTQDAAQHPPLECDGERGQRKEDQQRPARQMEFFINEEECQHQQKQDNIAAQQQAELGQEILGAERIIKPHQAVQQPKQRRHIQDGIYIIR